MVVFELQDVLTFYWHLDSVASYLCSLLRDYLAHLALRIRACIGGMDTYVLYTCCYYSKDVIDPLSRHSAN